MAGYTRTVILLAAMTALFGVIGLAIGGEQGMIMALIFAGGMNLFSWWNSDKMVLRMHNAQPIGPQEAPRLYEMTAQLAANAGLPMPALYVIHEAQPNAFATGRNPQHAAVAVNTGLLEMLSEEEAAGVIAHELAHIKNRDTLLMTEGSGLYLAGPALVKAASTILRLCMSGVSRHSGRRPASCQVMAGPRCKPRGWVCAARRSKK